MKRMLITAAAAFAASTSFAAPASAQRICHPDEPLTNCLERTRPPTDQVITLTFRTINEIGNAMGEVIVAADAELDNVMETAHDVCKMIFPCEGWGP